MQSRRPLAADFAKATRMMPGPGRDDEINRCIASALPMATRRRISWISAVFFEAHAMLTFGPGCFKLLRERHGQRARQRGRVIIF